MTRLGLNSRISRYIGYTGGTSIVRYDEKIRRFTSAYTLDSNESNIVKSYFFSKDFKPVFIFVFQFDLN
jgi:hypothetical protein